MARHHSAWAAFFTWGWMTVSTSRRSPMRATSTGTFLLISVGSISTWIFFALRA
jgi:hypothetical protein